MRDDDLLGWATGPLAELDELAPGLLRRTCTAAPLTRQAIFMALARWERSERPGSTTNAAQLLRDGRAGDIIKGLFGVLPEGLLGALERLGPQWLCSRESYGRLWTIYTDKDRRAAKALQYVGPISDRTLRVIDVLNAKLLHPEVLKRIDTRSQAVDFNRAINLLEAASSRVTDAALSEAFARMQSPTAIPRMLHRLLRTCDRFPPHPCTGDAELRPLQTARDLIEAARQFRNCLSSKIGDAVVGRVAFAEFRGVSAKAICEFLPLSNGAGWFLSEVHVGRNERVPHDVRAAAEQKCASFGIPHIAVPEDADWRSLRRIIRGNDIFSLAA